jgi:hypothetical protein
MCAAVSRRALPRPTAVDAKPCLFQFFRQLLLGSDFMAALPTATTARTLHDPSRIGAAEPVGALSSSRMHALPQRDMKWLTFAARNLVDHDSSQNKTDAGILLNT